MSDPFDALRGPETPIDPDPRFAADLRERLRRAVLDWKDTTVTPPEQHTRTDTDTGGDVEPPPAITPYIVVTDARAAIAWYTAVFDAHERGERHVMPDGAIGHAEIAVGDGVLMLADAAAAGGVPVAAPTPGQPASHTLHVRVDDVDAAFARAVAQGADAEREPTDYPYGRIAVLLDPFGHRWMLNTAPARAPRAAEVGYVTKVVADAEAAKAFYGPVLGWEFTPGAAVDGWQVRDRRIGLWGGGSPRVDLCFRVGDIDAAATAVRDHGGAAGEIEAKPYGRFVECTDPEGVAFQLWQP